MKMTPREQIAAARVDLINKRPYLAQLVLSLIPVETPGMAKSGGPIAVDKNLRLYYDPDFSQIVQPSECSGVLYHECLHILYRHHERCELIGADSLTWNIASDLAINSYINYYDRSDMRIPAWACTPDKFRFPELKTAEEYYEMLKKSGKKIKESVTSGGCGSCSGHKGNWESDDEASNGISRDEVDIIIRRVANDIANHKNRGSVPAHLARWADELLNPSVDWRTLLRTMVRRRIRAKLGAVDYTFKKMNRRCSMSDIILPAPIAPTANVAVVIDTSGSRSNRDLSQDLSDIKEIISVAGTSIGVYVVDAKVHVHKRVFKPDQIKLVGGGGTDMVQGIQAAARDRADLIIVLTDGYTPWPKRPINIPVIAAIDRRDNRSGAAVPSWITVVYRTDNQGG